MSTTETAGTNGRASAGASQLTAANRTVAIGDESFVYRRFGDDRAPSPPLLCLQHFRGNLDSWDPALVDRLAEHREVILLANRGVGASTGIVPEDATEMARDALRFVDAVGLKKIDVLGFSLGGFVAQEMALLRPRLLRRIVLAGTAPQGGPDLHRWSDEVYALATSDVSRAEHLLALFFSRSEASQAKGMEYLARAYTRQEGRDAETDLATRDAQLAAITAWGIPDASKLNRSASPSSYWSRTATTTASAPHRLGNRGADRREVAADSELGHQPQERVPVGLELPAQHLEKVPNLVPLFAAATRLASPMPSVSSARWPLGSTFRSSFDRAWDKRAPLARPSRPWVTYPAIPDAAPG